VTLANAHYGFREDAEVTIKAGEIATHGVVLPDGSLHVTAEPDSEIFVEGDRVGTAPLGPIQVPIGSREVVVRHPQFGERRRSIDVIVGEQAELSVLQSVSAPRTPPRLAPLSMPPERRSLAQ